MKFRLPSSLFVALVIAAASTDVVCEARRSSGGARGSTSRDSRGAGSVGRTSRGTSSSRRSQGPPPPSRRRPVDDYDDEPEEDDFDFKFPGDETDDEEANGGGYDDEDDNEYDEYDAEEDFPPRRGGRQAPQRSSSRGGGSSRGKSAPAHGGGRGASSQRGSSRVSSSRGSGRGASSRGRPGRPSTPSRGGRGASSQSGRVVPYGNRRNPQPGAFSRGIAALRESIPDPSTIKETAFSSISAARETTSKISSNLYRDIKGLTSSELEQVMLKATQPNDVAVKGSHVERLVGVTYQISGRYDIYDAVLRKLWSKMVEKDWRTNIKALYILHRFSADGAPDHQAALKARLRELRRTRDPKRKEKFFNSKQLLAGDATPANAAFRAFLARYAHYVLLRAQCFGGVFAEIANDPNDRKNKSKKTSSRPQQKCITATCLKNEHLEAAQMLLKAGLACALKEEEECENTAIAVERVVSDLIGLTTATATALNNALTTYDRDSDLDRELVKKWCEFYSDDLFPQTKAMMKSTSPTLDAYGLFLPSRMGTTVSQDLLQKGLQRDDTKIDDEPQQEDQSSSPSEDVVEKVNDEPEETEEEVVEDDNVYDEYEYDEYEYDEY